MCAKVRVWVVRENVDVVGLSVDEWREEVGMGRGEGDGWE